MSARHVTAKGRPFDMAAIKANNPRKRALGNTGKNAHGDVVDKKGVVLKTQEQITAEWAAAKRQRETYTKPANIKSTTLLADLAAPVKPTKHVNVPDQHFDAEPIPMETPKPSRRKMTESDK